MRDYYYFIHKKPKSSHNHVFCELVEYSIIPYAHFIMKVAKEAAQLIKTLLDEVV
jgi:hypothetical protein